MLTPPGWGAAPSEDLCLQVLSEMDEFKNLDSDIEGSAKRWKKFVESEVPEKEVFPKEWKNKTALQKLCMLRCMRPDRMTYAVRCPHCTKSRLQPARVPSSRGGAALLQELRGREDGQQVCGRQECGVLQVVRGEQPLHTRVFHPLTWS